MKKILIAAFAAGIMATAVNAQTAPSTVKTQTTTTTQTKPADKKEADKKEVGTTTKKTVKHHKKAHAVTTDKAAPAAK